MKNYDFPEAVLKDIIRQAVKEGKLFELLFTEEGKRLWNSWPEERMKRFVLKELRKVKNEGNKGTSLQSFGDGSEKRLNFQSS